MTTLPRRSRTRSFVTRFVVAAVLVPAVLVGACTASFLVQKVVSGCAELPGMGTDACRDPYQVLNWTDGPLTIGRVAADGGSRTLITIERHTIGYVELIPPGTDRCQDGFGLVALDGSGAEVARLDRWCRYDLWIVVAPGATLPPM